MTRFYCPFFRGKPNMVFSITSDCILPVVIAPAWVAPPFEPEKPTTEEAFKQYNALWDTGASISGINKKVVDDLGLKKVNRILASSARGRRRMTDVYCCVIKISDALFYLPVLMCNPSNADILIGMDIISRGDLALTHFDRKTCLSFRVPSIERIEFADNGTV